MFNPKRSGNLYGLFLSSCLLIFLHASIAAQCGGTYFKKLSTTLVPINGIMSASADLNGDGIPDLTGIEENTQQIVRDKFIILPSNGSGGFGAPITFNTPGETIYRYVVGDFDNDTYKDILLIHYLKYRVYRNNGDGTFTAQTLVENGQVIIPLFLIDINNDGKGDFISEKQGGVYYEIGNGDGTFQSPVRITTKQTLLAGDFNADSKIDFIDGSDLFLNQGNGTFTTVTNPITLGTNEIIRDVRDYTGDGKADIATVTETLNGKVSLFTNLGNNSFQRTDYPFSFPNLSAPATFNFIPGNFSGNASPDILLSVPLFTKTLVYTNNGTGTFTQQTFDYKFNGNLTGDFDGDGKTDSVVLSNGNRYATPAHKLFSEITATVQKNVCNPFGQSRIVDYNASGATDYSYWTPSNGRWVFLPSEPPYLLTYVINWGSASNGDIPAPGDFDGDGKTDRAVYRNSTGVWWIFRTSDGQPSAVQFGLPGDKPVVGDYDGDSISDLAVWRPSDGNWYILFMGTQSYTIAHWGQSGDKPVPEDYDGDGKTDLAIFRPSTGTWYVLKSSDLNFFALQFGISTDRPIAADYDGDGKADIAVQRDSTSVFYVLRSYNLDFAAYQYGSAGDIPQPGDYDGDFVSDFSVFRPSNGSWYVFYNSSPINFGVTNVIPTSSLLRIE
ncbi:MAG TPA: VCBS repeat-containing protein [Pyrinomonadaceae bacterium]